MVADLKGSVPTVPLMPHVRDAVVGEECIVTMLQHLGSKWGDNGKCLDVVVPQHLIGPPAAKQANDIGVHSGTKQGHGTRGA